MTIRSLQLSLFAVGSGFQHILHELMHILVSVPIISLCGLAALQFKEWYVEKEIDILKHKTISFVSQQAFIPQ